MPETGQSQQLNSTGQLPFLDKIKYVFTSPSTLFEGIRNERGIGTALLTLLGLTTVFSILGYIMNLTLHSSDWGMYGQGTALYGFIFIPIGILFGIIMGFVIAAIIHVFIKIFGGQADFATTYRILAYSSIPSLMLSIIPLIGWLSFIYSLILDVMGISMLHSISKGKAVAAMLLPIVILFILILVISFSFMFTISSGAFIR